MSVKSGSGSKEARGMKPTSDVIFVLPDTLATNLLQVNYFPFGSNSPECVLQNTLKCVFRKFFLPLR